MHHRHILIKRNKIRPLKYWDSEITVFALNITNNNIIIKIITRMGINNCPKKELFCYKKSEDKTYNYVLNSFAE